MNKKEHYRTEYRKKKPDWQASSFIYKELISSNVSKNTKILDIGCGHRESLRDIYNQTEFTYGIDPHEESIAKNRIIKNKTVGSAENLPFEQNFFDIVVLTWVLEHLKNPKKAFEEIYRVLKPGGQVIFLTPNTLNYNVWLIRVIPNRFHEYLTRRLYSRKEKDTFPVRYAINTPGKIESTLASKGFQRRHLIFNGDPAYLSMNNISFRIACFLENILSVRFFQSLKVHIIGVYVKL